MAIEKSITVETKDVGPGREKKNKRFAYKPNTVSNGHDPFSLEFHNDFFV
tara:strand:+ start:126 stop:275 length:150 start_codon:yes stop_codon:yes gene_type:complete